MAEAESDWMDFDDIFEEYDDGPPFKFKVDVTNDCYKKASSKANFAVQLVRRCYSRTERSTSNCSGDHRYRKRKLSPIRMEAVKKATFAVYPVKPGERREDAWKQYKIAIDTSCRQISRPKKTAKW